jgi:hypothetical protein
MLGQVLFMTEPHRAQPVKAGSMNGVAGGPTAGMFVPPPVPNEPQNMAAPPARIGTAPAGMAHGICMAADGNREGTGEEAVWRAK